MAAPNVHLEIAEIKGDSSVDGYKEQIDCVSWAWGSTQSANMHVSIGGAAGASHVQDITVVKMMDKASPNLMQNCMKGTHFGEMKLHCTKSAGNNRIEWYTITMTDCIISSVSQQGGGADQMGTEQVSINFAKCQTQYFEQAADGTQKAGPDVTYVINEAKEG